MSLLSSIIERFKLSSDKDNKIDDSDLFELVFDYYISSNITDDFQEAVEQLDTIPLDENYEWLLFTGFQAVITSIYYGDEERNKLCDLWLPTYESMLKKFLTTATTQTQETDSDHSHLNAIKYLIVNLIGIQNTRDSLSHILKTEIQFQNFPQRDQYFEIIKIILPLLINPNIVEQLHNDDHANIKLTIQPNDLSNTTNVTSTFAIWIILKTIIMFTRTDGDCLTIIKHDQNVKDILLKSMRLISDDNPIKLSIYAILALIMNEEDIKNEINDPKEIINALTSNIRKNLNSEDDDNELSVDGVYMLDILVALKAFLQHDQVKNDFIEDDGLEVLIDTIEEASEVSIADYINKDAFEAELTSNITFETEEEKEFAEKYVTQYTENSETDLLEMIVEGKLLALECLYAMCFSKEAVEVLKKNEVFMSRIRKLNAENDTTSTTNERMKKAVDGLLWKLEKEDQFKQQQPNITNEHNDDFDFMISYSWSDKPLVHEIYKYLTEEFNYKIWLDENQMAGSLCQAMAQAVEKSRFVLMCMSETYKGSENCRNEAEYARDRKKPIIPLVMKKVERDGWLGFISAGKMYVDFSTYDFQKAIQLLKQEIERNHLGKGNNKQPVKQKPKNSNEIILKPQPIVPLTTKLPVRSSVISKDYQNISIESWSEQHVQDFLYDNKLDLMILLTENMDGDDLHLLLEKCQKQQDYWPMFDRLNIELEKRHHQTLPISVYLRFLNKTQRYIGVSAF